MSDQGLHAEGSIGAMNLNNLMALASMDTSDLKAQVSRLPYQGIYIIDMLKLGLAEQPPSDPADPMSFNLVCQGAIRQFVPLKPEELPANLDLDGQNLNERIFLYGPQLKEAIQLLMGRFKQVGFRHKGVMGGVEGHAPGWIDEAIGKRIVVRVRHYTPKDGQERAAFDWLSPRQMEKLQIPWEVMQRPFLDETGKVVEDIKAAV